MSFKGGPLRFGLGMSATIGTSARLCGPNSGANSAARKIASVSAAMPCARAGERALPRCARKPAAALSQPACGSVGRCCSSAWVSVPRRKRWSLDCAAGGGAGGSSLAARLARAAARRAARRSRPARRLRGARAPAGCDSAGSRGAGRPTQAGNVATAAPCFWLLSRGLGGAVVARRGGDLASVGAVRLLQRVAERSADQLVPAAGRAAVLAFEAGDVEPVAGARHGDVEQPVALLGFALVARRPWPPRWRHARWCP